MGENSTNDIWREVWKNEGDVSPKDVFSNRLFVEGYPVFKKYILNTPFRLLDVGSGTGRYGVKFALDNPESSFVLTDILDESLVHIRSLAEATGVKNVSIQKEDVFHLSFPDENFDVVFCDVVIQHLTDDAGAVVEMSRVLKKGGLLLIGVVNSKSVHALVRNAQEIFGQEYRYGFERLYTRKVLQNLAEHSGLSVQALDGFYPAYGVYRLKRFWSGFSLLGRGINRITRFLDMLSLRGVSRHFGFELVLVARKPK